MKTKPPQSSPPFRLPVSVVLTGFLLIIGFLLLLEHRAHIPGDYWLLGGFLVICVFMHVFMHMGMVHAVREDHEPSHRNKTSENDGD